MIFLDDFNSGAVQNKKHRRVVLLRCNMTCFVSDNGTFVFGGKTKIKTTKRE